MFLALATECPFISGLLRDGRRQQATGKGWNDTAYCLIRPQMLISSISSANGSTTDGIIGFVSPHLWGRDRWLGRGDREMVLGDAPAFWTMHQDQCRAQHSARNAAGSEVK